MPRPAAVVLGWVAATAAAIAVAYAGVSTVAGGVVQPLPATVGQPPPVELAPSDAPTDTPSPSPTVPASPAAPSSSPRAVATPPSTSAPSAPAVQPASEVRSYALVGGVATLPFEPGRVTVVSAGPAQGFTVGIEGNGTAEVRVEFDSGTHRSRLRGNWEGGPRERIEEDDDRDDDDGRDDHDDDDGDDDDRGDDDRGDD